MTAPHDITPLDPNSTRGRELARDLTVVLAEIEEAIAARKRAAQRGASDTERGAA